MGNSNQTDKQPENNNLILNDCKEENLVYVKQISSDCYGDVTVSKSKITNNLYAVKSIFLSDNQEQQKLLQQILSFKELQFQNICRIIEIKQDNHENLCSNAYKTSLLIEYFDNSLLQEIEQHKQNNILFSEMEIAYMIYNIVQALVCFEYKAIHHEYIAPKNIVIGNDDFRYKLTNIQLFTGQTAYQNFVLGKKEPCYLSPILLTQLKQGKLIPVHNQISSDIFSLGMIALEMCILTNINIFYNFEDYCIQKVLLESNLNQIKSLYSENLQQLLVKMLTIDEEPRFTLEQIQQYVQRIWGEELQVYYQNVKQEKIKLVNNVQNNFNINQLVSSSKQLSSYKKESPSQIQQQPLEQIQQENQEHQVQYYEISPEQKTTLQQEQGKYLGETQPIKYEVLEEKNTFQQVPQNYEDMANTNQNNGQNPVQEDLALLSNLNMLNQQINDAFAHSTQIKLDYQELYKQQNDMLADNQFLEQLDQKINQKTKVDSLNGSSVFSKQLLQQPQQQLQSQFSQLQQPIQTQYQPIKPTSDDNSRNGDYSVWVQYQQQQPYKSTTSSQAVLQQSTSLAKQQQPSQLIQQQQQQIQSIFSNQQQQKIIQQTLLTPFNISENQQSVSNGQYSGQKSQNSQIKRDAEDENYDQGEEQALDSNSIYQLYLQEYQKLKQSSSNK